MLPLLAESVDVIVIFSDLHGESFHFCEEVSVYLPVSSLFFLCPLVFFSATPVSHGLLPPRLFAMLQELVRRFHIISKWPPGATD